MHVSYDWIADYNRIIPHFHKESDRAAAMLAVSFLGAATKRRFAEHLVADKVADRLFDPYQPLSTFSAVIDMSFGLGLLTRGMHSDLTLIRKTRNHFAHHPDHSTFDTSPVTDWCGKLSTATGIPTQTGSPWTAPTAREQFLFAIAICLTYFDRLVGAQGRRQLPQHPSPP